MNINYSCIRGSKIYFHQNLNGFNQKFYKNPFIEASLNTFTKKLT